MITNFKIYERLTFDFERLINDILSGKLIMEETQLGGYVVREDKNGGEYYNVSGYLNNNNNDVNIKWYISFYPTINSKLEFFRLSLEEMKTLDHIYKLSPEEKEELYQIRKYNL